MSHNSKVGSLTMRSNFPFEINLLHFRSFTSKTCEKQNSYSLAIWLNRYRLEWIYQHKVPINHCKIIKKHTDQKHPGNDVSKIFKPGKSAQRDTLFFTRLSMCHTFSLPTQKYEEMCIQFSI